ncbi:MAG TPA: DUF2092 domain-containing protein [Rubrivivax sp.]|nr:DUF2092 domain-containing protein [Rubrivivax sp.]
MTTPHAAASRAAAALACLVLATSTLAQGTTPAAKPAQAAKPAAKAAKPPRVPLLVEQRALDIIKATSARLAAAKAMSFSAIVDIEYPSKLGPPLAYPVRYDVAMQRPDKLRVLQSGAGAANEFYYDGKMMMAYVPEANLVAVADAPPTIEAALKLASDRAAIYYPFMDLLLPDPYAAFTNKVLHAFYIGPSGAVGGVPTEAVAWATNDVFIQMWVGTEDKLPRRIRAMFAMDPLKLRHDMQLSNWQIDPTHAAETFASQKAQSAPRIPFAKPAAVAPPPGSKAAPKPAKPASTTPAPKAP